MINHPFSSCAGAAMKTLARERTDVTGQRSEPWRPPPLTSLAGATGTERLYAAARRFFDLQAGSIWRDLSQLLPQFTGIVLDVGCGAQPYRNLLPADAQYVGLDTADAEKHFGYAAADIIHFEGGAWPLADASVDVVLCTETLEHVFDTTGFLAEMARVLRPGGQVILTVSFAARYHFIPHDYWRFTPACLDRLFCGANLTPVIVYARGNAVTVACYKVMALILPLLFSNAPPASSRLLRPLAGAALLPLLTLLAVIANLSLHLPGGNDCLGYTVLAQRPGGDAADACPFGQACFPTQHA